MEITMQDLIQKMREAAILFNLIVDNGRSVDELYVDQLIKRLDQQYWITKEEVDETLKAIEENDIVEYYDGLADILFTATFLLTLDNRLIVDFNIGDSDLSMHKEYTELGDQIIEILKRDDIDLEILNEVCDRVIENNKQKFTTDQEDFLSWESDHYPKSLEIDGVIYYFFVDENGKVKKHKGFKELDIKDLFTQGDNIEQQ